MELLITSTKPAPLSLGKVAAAGISGVLQFGLIVLAALGSTVSRVEDVTSATAVVQFIFIAGYIASTAVMYDPAGMAAVITSLIPFTAVMVMPIRAGMMTVPIAELLISGALMLASLAVFAWLSIKIYRWGSLNYGNKLNMKKLVREVIKARH